jgi:two-component system response regulator RegX3
MDINMEDETGFLVCKKIRENSEVPIIFISARQSDDDVLIALNIGGDDYVKKPYSLSVLLAKVKVMLKRMTAKNNLEPSKGKANKDIELNGDRMSIRLKDKEIPLKAREYSLLEYLYKHRNTIVTKEALFGNVWGNEFFSDGTLNVHIRRLREKLEDNPNEPKLIKTIWGTGYMLEL